MEQIRSFLGGEWVTGEGRATTLVNPSTEAPLATTVTEGLDLAGALAFAREQGGPALRAMTFAERGAMLRALSEAVVAARNNLLEFSMLNNGATRSDAKFDVDGASFTLAAYADLGEALGDKVVGHFVVADVNDLCRETGLCLHVGVHLGVLV